jgi:hypothetical protein
MDINELAKPSQHEPGAKLDQNKPDLSLLVMFGRALTAVGEVGTLGAKKYTRGGWLEVPDGVNRYTAAMLRHLFAEDREENDQELGVPHAAQVAWNALARLELMLQAEARKVGVLWIRNDIPKVQFTGEDSLEGGDES